MSADKDGDIKMVGHDEDGSDEKKIDEALYSRQLYVMGHEAMHAMQSSNVLIAGLNGLGVEIAKNVILAGVKSVSLYDPTKCTINDMASQFYLTEDDIKSSKNRAEASLKSLQSLNRYVDVKLVDPQSSLDESLLSTGSWTVLVLIGYPLSIQLKLNGICRKLGIKFISSECLGVFGSIFVDFGPSFFVKDVNGEQPLSSMIVNVSRAENALVTTHEDSRHGLSTGDFVSFDEIRGMTELNEIVKDIGPIKVKSPFTFEIPVDTREFHEYKGNGIFTQKKQPKTVKFEPLESQLAKPNFLPSDFTKDPSFHHLFYRGINQFREENAGKLPDPTSKEDADKVVSKCNALKIGRDSQDKGSSKETESKEAPKGLTENEKEIIWGLARASSGMVNPMAAFFGGMVGQEVLKACTGKFSPIEQFFYSDSFEALPSKIDKEKLSTEFGPKSSRYDDNIAVFGKTLQQRMHSSKLFLIGAGAIGCETLKNWALMGVGLKNSGGSITVTDMDIIETSNLNRQFLFRSSDVGKFKSDTACQATLAMNPALKLISHQNRVGEDSEKIYNQFFWSDLSCVCTALDNVNARLYVDSQCVSYNLPLLESGTLGTKGNTQIVVPGMTESYGSTRDPPEKDIPICTLKNFPNKIEHTIQWARDDFEGVFNQGPSDINRYANEGEGFLTEIKSSSEETMTLERLKSDLVDSKPIKFDDCIQWARLKFEYAFNHQIQQMLHNFPADFVTAEGALFWSGPKRAPSPIIFNPDDPLHMAFVVSAANLRAFVYGLKGTKDIQTFKEALKKVEIPMFIPKKIKIASSDEEAREMGGASNAEDPHGDVDKRLASLRDSLPSQSSLSGMKLNAIEFEKDDPLNGHIDFIWSCANLRARNYTIKESSIHETKGIAGKIIPAIATTTALVTGLIGMEFWKLNLINIHKEKWSESLQIELFRNCYVNLALPLVAMSEPAPCGSNEIVVKGESRHFSMWDQIEINQGREMRLSGLIDYFSDEWGLNLTMLSYGPSILFAFFHAPEKQAKRKKAKLRKLVQAVTKKKIEAGTKFLCFEVGCEDPDSGEDVELPTLRVDISK